MRADGYKFRCRLFGEPGGLFTEVLNGKPINLQWSDEDGFMLDPFTIRVIMIAYRLYSHDEVRFRTILDRCKLLEALAEHPKDKAIKAWRKRTKAERPPRHSSHDASLKGQFNLACWSGYNELTDTCNIEIDLRGLQYIWELRESKKYEDVYLAMRAMLAKNRFHLPLDETILLLFGFPCDHNSVYSEVTNLVDVGERRYGEMSGPMLLVLKTVELLNGVGDVDTFENVRRLMAAEQADYRAQLGRPIMRSLRGTLGLEDSK